MLRYTPAEVVKLDTPSARFFSLPPSRELHRGESRAIHHRAGCGTFVALRRYRKVYTGGIVAARENMGAPLPRENRETASPRSARGKNREESHSRRALFNSRDFCTNARGDEDRRETSASTGSPARPYLPDTIAVPRIIAIYVHRFVASYGCGSTPPPPSEKTRARKSHNDILAERRERRDRAKVT